MISKTKTKEAKNTTPQFDSHVKEYYKFKNQWSYKNENH